MVVHSSGSMDPPFLIWMYAAWVQAAISKVTGSSHVKPTPVVKIHLYTRLVRLARALEFIFKT